jgi:hypothetical protein
MCFALEKYEKRSRWLSAAAMSESSFYATALDPDRRRSPPLCERYVRISTGAAGFSSGLGRRVWIDVQARGADNTLHIHRPGPGKIPAEPEDLVNERFRNLHGWSPVSGRPEEASDCP